MSGVIYQKTLDYEDDFQTQVVILISPKKHDTP